MLLTVRELLDHPKLRSELYFEPEKCTGCGQPLSEFVTGQESIGQKVLDTNDLPQSTNS